MYISKGSLVIDYYKFRAAIISILPNNINPFQRFVTRQYVNGASLILVSEVCNSNASDIHSEVLQFEPGSERC